MDVQDSLKRIGGLSQDPSVLVHHLPRILNTDRCPLLDSDDRHCLIKVEALRTGLKSQSQPSCMETKSFSCRLRLSMDADGVSWHVL